MKRYIAGLAVPVMMLAVVLGTTYAQGQKFILRVIAGNSSTYKDKAGNEWKADKSYIKGNGFGFVGGDTVDRGDSVTIGGTEDPKIYQTEHYAMDRFVAEVPNGTYAVRLHFAETYEDIASDGPRVFDVKIQGQTVLSGFDVAKTAGGVQKALVKEFKGIQVSDGIIDISFVANQQNPEINGIEIIGE
jgi:endoglucanase